MYGRRLRRENMDTGRGYFEEIHEVEDTERQLAEIKKLQNKFQNYGGTFKVGEQIELKGSIFKVHEIKPKKLILKLLTKG